MVSQVPVILPTTSAEQSSNKRAITSPNGSPEAKKVPDRDPSPKFNVVIGYLERLVTIERTKKLSAQTSDTLLEKLAELRNIMHALSAENSKLKGRLAGREEAMRDSLTTFVTKISEKTVEIEEPVGKTWS